jgi:hypothetical protein
MLDLDGCEMPKQHRTSMNEEQARTETQILTGDRPGRRKSKMAFEKDVRFCVGGPTRFREK